MKKTPLKALIIILFCAVLLLFCRSSYIYQIPEQTNDGWQVAGLDDVGIDEKTLSKLIERIHDNTYQNVHSILIVKDGKLVFEEYFGGYEFEYEGD